MNIPEGLRYSTDHEWALIEGDTVKVGITDYAQDALGDVVYVDLPAVGSSVEAGGSFGEVESTKSVSDLYAPVSGEVVQINDDLADAPERLNEDPYGEGWILHDQDERHQPARRPARRRRLPGARRRLSP